MSRKMEHKTGQKTFMDFVEETTDRIEQQLSTENPGDSQDVSTEAISESQDVPTEPQQQRFEPKQDMAVTQEVTKRIADIWHTIHHHADYEQWLDIILAALERREDDYMRLIKGIDKKVLEAYTKMYAELYKYFLDGYYGDPLGDFYQEFFSYGRGGEYYTPWNVAYFMVEIMNPTPDENIIDPCCGSGILLLAARCFIHKNYGWIVSSRYGRNLYGMDISSRAAKMAKINIYLTDYVYMICLMHNAVLEFKQKTEIPEQKVK